MRRFPEGLDCKIGNLKRFSGPGPEPTQLYSWRLVLPPVQGLQRLVHQQKYTEGPILINKHQKRQENHFRRIYEISLVKIIIIIKFISPLWINLVYLRIKFINNQYLGIFICTKVVCCAIFCLKKPVLVLLLAFPMFIWGSVVLDDSNYLPTELR